MNRDSLFLSRQFETIELPREKAYLYKYFKTKVQDAFLKYVFVFGDHTNFTDHTGFQCSERWLKILHDRLSRLELAHREAKTNIDLETLTEIETGRYRV